MDSHVRLRIGATAALVIAIAGCQSTPAGLGTAVPSPAPGATTSAIAIGSPGPSLVPRLPSETPDLQAGTYLLETAMPVTIEAAGGWSTCCGGAILKNDFAGLIYFENAQGLTVYSDPCLWSSGGQSKPEGMQSIAAALAVQKDREGSEPQAVTVGGTRAFVVRLKVPLDQPVTKDAHGDSTFIGCDDGQFRSFTLGPDGERNHQAPGQIDDMYVVEVHGTTFIFDVISGPDTPASDVAELRAMLDSIRFHPPE